MPIHDRYDRRNSRRPHSTRQSTTELAHGAPLVRTVLGSKLKGRGARAWLWRFLALVLFAVMAALILPGVLTRLELDYLPQSSLATWYGQLKDQYPLLLWLADLDPKILPYGDHWYDWYKGYNAATWIGVAGTILMAPLALYSLQKRTLQERSATPLPLARRLTFHIVLGALAPILILYHSGFKLALFMSDISVLSWVTLWSLIVVIASGFFGRYFFPRLLSGLHLPLSIVMLLVTTLHIVVVHTY